MATNKSFDVIVVGAGSVGTPTALSLAEAGLKVLVLDQFPSVGQGSNKRAIGGLRATHSDPAKIRLCLRSLEIFSTWKERHGDDIEWLKGGYSYVAYRPEEERTLKELLTVQKSYGLNIDWHDAAVFPRDHPGPQSRRAHRRDLFARRRERLSPARRPRFLQPGEEARRRVPLQRTRHGSYHGRRAGRRRAHRQGRVRGADRGQRGRAVGSGDRGHGRDRRPRPSRFPRGRGDRGRGPLPRTHGRRHPAGRRLGQLLFLSARHGPGHLLHHAEPQHLGDGRPRDELVPAHGRQPHGRAHPPAQEPPRPADVARALSHDPGRLRRSSAGPASSRDTCWPSACAARVSCSVRASASSSAAWSWARPQREDRETLTYLSPYREFKGQEKLK